MSDNTDKPINQEHFRGPTSLAPVSKDPTPRRATSRIRISPTLMGRCSMAKSCWPVRFPTMTVAAVAVATLTVITNIVSATADQEQDGFAAVSTSAHADESGRKHFGLLEIPRLGPVLSPALVKPCDMSHICHLEYVGRFEEAYAAYESMLPTCGDHGWATLASLGKGKTASVLLKRTPCGTLVAAKVPSTIELSEFPNIRTECVVLKRLAPFISQCNGCFPRYYYHSSLTGICYSEFLQGAVTLDRLILTLPRDSSGDTLEVVKSVMSQTLNALTILKNNQITHRDLLYKNIMVVPTPRSDNASGHWFRIVVIDFCWSYSKSDPEAHRNTTRPINHFGRPPDWSVARLQLCSD